MSRKSKHYKNSFFPKKKVHSLRDVANKKKPLWKIIVNVVIIIIEAGLLICGCLYLYNLI